MEKFRILLDLSKLEDRVDKYVWMLISTTELKYVADLKKAVINKLALNRNDIKMYINGGLLLEEENIFVLEKNDTVQIQYGKLANSACHSSSYMEMGDRNILNIEEYNGIEKHSKKHKKKSKEVSLEVANENIENDERDMATIDNFERCKNALSIQDDYYMNGNDIHVEGTSSGKKKKHKKSVSTLSTNDVIIQGGETSRMPVVSGANAVTLLKRDALSIQDGYSMNGNNIHVEGPSNGKKKKHKKSVGTLSTNDVIIQGGETSLMPVVSGANTVTLSKSYQESKRMGKINNNEEINIMDVVYDANSITVDKYYQESKEMEKNNYFEGINLMPVAADTNTIIIAESYKKSEQIEEHTPTDIVVESFIQGSACKKRKRKRIRKRKLQPNLLGPFMSSNMNSLQNLEKETPPISIPCDNFGGIRKHIRFTSPDSSNKNKETVKLETNCSDSIETVDLGTDDSNSEEEISPTKTPNSTAAKMSTLPTRKMYIDNANQIANKVYSNMSPSSSNTCTLPNTEISSMTTCMTSVNHVNQPSPKLLSENCIEPSTSTVSFPTNPKFGHSPTMKQAMFTATKQKSLPQNSLNASPMMRKNDNKSTPEVSVLKSKECDPSKPSIPSSADYSEIPLQKVLPPVGSRVAFKLLELDENYTPHVSSYKEGLIKSINQKTEEIAIKLIKAEIKPGRTGKFENLNEDETPSDEVVDWVTTSWSLLIEPRLISLGLEEE